MEEESGRGRSLAETPTWSVATVTTVLVAVCFIVERSIHRFAKWLVRTKRKPLLAALDKIKEELMLLGLISLILVQSSRIISDICVESKIYSSRFYPCTLKDFDDDDIPTNHSIRHSSLFHGRRLNEAGRCKKGFEPFVSLESMEQLHRFLFVLGVTHVLYSFLTMLLSMIKIYSWKKWEMEAHSKLLLNKPDQTRRVFRRQTTFVIHQTSHPWSKNKVLIWLLCFLRQFVRTVTKADYTALRMGFITNHRLRFSYDFHSYMVRTMEDEFRDIVGISWQLWGYAILCIFFNLHGLNFYFWIAFIPAILILLLGTKLQHVIAKLALENTAVVDQDAGTPVRPRDELFWFDKPELLLWLIQFITFQNAFEMASFIWSWWQIQAHTCFMKHHAFVYTRLISGLVVQFWCSYSILPLYAIVTQMGSRFKKALIAEDIRESLHGWRKRVKDRAAKRDSSHHGSIFSTQTSTLSESAKRFASYHGSIFSKQSSSISVSESAKRSASHHGNLFSTPTPTVSEPIKLIADVNDNEAQVEVIENESKAAERELPTVMERELSIIPDNDVCEIERVMSLESHISKRYDGGSKVYDNELYNYNDDVLEVNVDSEEERLMEHSMSMRLQEVSDEALAIELSQLSSSDEESDSDSSDEDQQEEEAPLNSSESSIADDAPKVFP